MTALLLIGALASGRAAFAHEGHPHKVMGTVSSLHEHTLDVKGADGKSVSIVLNDKTKIVRGTKVTSTSDIKTGDRVVVTAIEKRGSNGKLTSTASEVRLAAATEVRSKK